MSLRPRTLFVIVLLVAAAVMLVIASERWANSQAAHETDQAAEQTARAHAGLLASELQKFRLLPQVLSEYPDVAAVLGGSAPAAEARLNETLELLANRTDAAVIYVIGLDGRTVAASNWRLPTSFIGQNYGFRPYFRDAMRSGNSELFALGTVSGRPGLYLARRVEQGRRAIGAIVVKVEFDSLESSLGRAGGATFVTDPRGVVLVTSVPGWRFRSTHALDAATLADAQRTLQFGPTPPAPLPFTLEDREVDIGRDRYRAASLPVALEGAQLIHLEPLAPALATAKTRARLWGLGLLLVAVVGAAALIRDADRRRLQREAREALEAEVARRTAELSDANARLLVESAEREEADQRYRLAREELAQANRLGSLGQITAGVAHEINQPVAAIRTFAENATTFLEREATDKVRGNLAQIVSLTARIGAITAELRGFARRKTPAKGSTAIGAAIDGAMLLMGDRARGSVQIDIAKDVRSARVVGDRVRVEQVLINLLQNALDAARHVVVTAHAEEETIALTVSDDGPGVDPELADKLFTPFVSGKPQGLGLGLAIARDIAREFGGELTLAKSALDGASFQWTLKRA